jgi:hypothetical protein
LSTPQVSYVAVCFGSHAALVISWILKYVFDEVLILNNLYTYNCRNSLE